MRIRGSGWEDSGSRDRAAVIREEQDCATERLRRSEIKFEVSHEHS